MKASYWPAKVRLIWRYRWPPASNMKPLGSRNDAPRTPVLPSVTALILGENAGHEAFDTEPVHLDGECRAEDARDDHLQHVAAGTRIQIGVGGVGCEEQERSDQRRGNDQVHLYPP